MKKLLTIIISIAVLSLFINCDGELSLQNVVDSLNMCAFDNRYVSLDSTIAYSRKAFKQSDNNEGRAYALNNLAFVEYMRMDYDRARSLYEQSNKITHSELVRLMNDIGMMDICYITAQNKEFHEYRGAAERRIKRIEEAEDELTDIQLRRLNYARSEYHILSSKYYTNMWQGVEADSELVIVENHRDWLKANPAQLSKLYIARNNYRRAENISEERQLKFLQAYSMLYQSDSTDISYARTALEMFREYGSLFNCAIAYVKIADYYLQQGYPEIALDTACKALEYVNLQHQRLYGKESDFLMPYQNTSDTLSVEIHWMKDGNITCAWEWIAIIREELSRIYAAMGMKVQSDYNRNIYLDILEATRQDKLLEQRMEQMKSDEHKQNVLLAVIVLLSALLLFAAYMIMRRLRRWAQQRYNRELSHTEQKFDEWMKNQYQLFESIDEQEQMLDSQNYMCEQRIAEQKRSYIDKCTSMSMVRSIVPFLDRAINEVNHLVNSEESIERKKKRIEYLLELIEKINNYNDILSHWIKVRQGVVSLHIESFELQPLIDTLSKNINSFLSKGINLIVMPSSAVVKADKALTLFMMNTLLDNARKYTPNGGNVCLETKELDDSVEISVSDTGYGISKQDIKTILTEKVYDSTEIGKKQNIESVIQAKGFGFGLMNCKGIIDKYKKTSPQFSVCSLNIESEEGKGSKFSFRLPKSVIKTFVLLLFALSFSSVNVKAKTHNTRNSDNPYIPLATQYADSTYYSNVDGRYYDALSFADSALQYINAAYEYDNPHSQLCLSLYSDSEYPDISLWQSKYDFDYGILKSIRNEAAVAALALQEWDIYIYNNNVYTRLYKLTSQDDSINRYCEEIRSANLNRQTTIVVFILLVIISCVFFLIFYYHRYILKTFNLRQLNQLGTNLFSVNDDTWIDILYRDINDIKAIDGICIGIIDNEGKINTYSSSEFIQEKYIDNILVNSAVNNERMVLDNKKSRVYPLTIIEKGQDVQLGAFYMQLHGRGVISADEERVFDMVLQYISTYIYYTIFKLNIKTEELLLKEDEYRRIEREEADAHVQNLVLDNCLSAIKHETMYYPSRIFTLIKKMKQENSLDVNKEKIADIYELIQYYSGVFTLLSEQAANQLENVMFRRKRIGVDTLNNWASRYIKKINKTHEKNIILLTEHSNVTIIGDDDMTRYLVENLMLCCVNLSSDKISVTYSKTNDERSKIMVKGFNADYVDTETLFYTDIMQYNESEDVLTGVEWMICRQIVREHDEHTGRRGCRISADYQDNTIIISVELN